MKPDAGLVRWQIRDRILEPPQIRCVESRADAQRAVLCEAHGVRFGEFTARRHGDPELLRPLDGLLEGFIRDRRMKIAGEYRPCYRLVA